MNQAPMACMLLSKFFSKFIKLRNLQKILKLLMTTLIGFWSSSALAKFTLNMPKGVTEISRDIYHLHMAMFWVCVAVGILVFVMMFYAILYHRKSLGVKAAHFHENTTIELIWTIIPFIILVAMAVPATKLLIKMGDTRDSTLTIKITGHQWRWEYDYLGQDLRFVSNLKTTEDQIKNRDIKNEYYLHEVDNPLVVPVGQKIRFLVTAADVIHSWWVNELGIKRDAIPGFINESWAIIEEPGTYRGQCAELCGVNHGFMPIVVIAKTEQEYSDWLAKKKAELAPKPEAEETQPQAPAQPQASEATQPAQPATQSEAAPNGKSTSKSTSADPTSAQPASPPPANAQPKGKSSE